METAEQVRIRMKYPLGPHKVSFRQEHDMWAVEFPDSRGVKDWANTEAKAKAMCAAFDLNPFDFEAACHAAKEAAATR